jgi:biotin operon repressor
MEKIKYSQDLEAVKQDGYALQDVKEQTPEICLAAVQQNGYALQFVKEQTPEIRAALEQDSLVLR